MASEDLSRFAEVMVILIAGCTDSDRASSWSEIFDRAPIAIVIASIGLAIIGFWDVVISID